MRDTRDAFMQRGVGHRAQSTSTRELPNFYTWDYTLYRSLCLFYALEATLQKVLAGYEDDSYNFNIVSKLLSSSSSTVPVQSLAYTRIVALLDAYLD